MSSKGTQFKTALLHPRHWPIWLAFGLWRVVTVLPYPLLLLLGKGIMVNNITGMMVLVITPLHDHMGGWPQGNDRGLRGLCGASSIYQRSLPHVNSRLCCQWAQSKGGVWVFGHPDRLSLCRAVQ